MASIQTLERRILALEARLHRASVTADLRMGRVLTHLHIADDVSDDQVDEALDQQ